MCKEFNRKYRVQAIETITELEDMGIIEEDTWYINGGYAHIEFEVGNDEIGTEKMELDIDIEDMEYSKVLEQINEEKQKYIAETLQLIEDDRKEREYQDSCYYEIQGAKTGTVRCF